MVFALMLVGVMMFEARKPETWRWMWGGQSEQSGTDENIDTRLQTTPRSVDIVDSFSSKRLPAVSQRPAAGGFPRLTESQTSVIRDDTPFRAAEAETWFEIARQLQSSEASQVGEPAEFAGFVQLFRQPDTYRCQRVRVEGIVRRAHYVPARENAVGIDGYWQCWLFSSDSSRNPIVVYALSMPDGFPTGMKVFERVSFIGVFFKRWAYQASGGTMTAPLVVSNQVDWAQAPAPPPAEPLNWTFIVSVSLFIGLTVCWLVYVQSKQVVRRRQPTDLDSGPSKPDDGPSKLPDIITKMILLCMAWQVCRADSATAQPATHPAADARAMMQVFRIDVPALDACSDGVAITEAERPLLWQILNRCPEFPLDRLERWAATSGGSSCLNALQLKPGQSRGLVVRLPIQVRHISAHQVENDRLPFRRFFSVVAVADNGIEIIIYCRRLPEAWERFVDREEIPKIDGSFTGLFLKVAAAGPAFVAHRVAWHPKQSQAILPVSSGQIALAQRGFDLGLLDHLTDKSRLKATERECFYAMLAAVNRENLSFPQPNPQATDVADLLQHPEQLRGNRFLVQGTGRRAIRIKVDDPDIQSRFDIDHYYEIEVFVDSAVQIKLVDGDQSRQFNRYPVVVCSRLLPDNMPVGDDIRVPLQVTGYFLKYWAYRTSESSGDSYDPTPNQFSPMLIGNGIHVIEPTKNTTSALSWLLGGLFACSILGIAAYIAISDRNASQHRAQRRKAANMPHPQAPPLQWTKVNDSEVKLALLVNSVVGQVATTSLNYETGTSRF